MPSQVLKRIARRVSHALLASIALLHGTVHAEDAPGPLHINPFVQPEAVAGAAGEAAVSEDGSMELRGIMFAGEHSLANIGGRIVAIGQDINGYRLIAVNESNVVLDRDGTRKELEVRKQDGVGKNERVNRRRR